MAAPNSAHTNPSHAASTAPSIHPRMAGGPCMARTISGRVTKGPTPIILIMFSEIAPPSPIPRTTPSSLAMFGIFLAAEQELVFGSLLHTEQTAVLGFLPNGAPM